MVILRRIDPSSVAKTLGTLYALIGFVFGGIMSIAAMFGAPRGQVSVESVFVGLGAVILMPLLYGIGGLIGGFIMAALYNFVASLTGGIKFELESERDYQE